MILEKEKKKYLSAYCASTRASALWHFVDLVDNAGSDDCGKVLRRFGHIGLVSVPYLLGNRFLSCCTSRHSRFAETSV